MESVLFHFGYYSAAKKSASVNIQARVSSKFPSACNNNYDMLVYVITIQESFISTGMTN
jgi:hypothetical protein